MKDSQSSYEELLKSVAEELHRAKRILIVAHSSPDGDTLGSALALFNGLRRLKKECRLYCKDPVPDRYRFLPSSEYFSTRLKESDFDATVLLDHGEVDQAGEEFVEFKGKGRVLNLGHHRYHKPYGDIDVNNSEKASTGIVVYDLLNTMGIELDRDIAICIYTTILTDTGSFRYANTDSEAFRICSKLIKYDIDPWYISMNVYENYPVEKLYLMREALNNLYLADSGKYGSMAIFKKTMDQTGASPDLLDGMINLVRGIDSVEIAVLFREIENSLFRVSFRSKGNYNVALVASRFGGGGHKNSAGCQITGNYEDVRRAVYKEIERCMQDGSE